MKLRLLGPLDVVTYWASKLRALGFEGREYPAREAGWVRWYGDIDDRRAMEGDLRQLALPFPKRKRVVVVEESEADKRARVMRELVRESASKKRKR